ncbi:MAG: sugar phosphorylase [Chloroflexi bacterium]|nr:sugar phosphorylase [Chloroflexota bacterium]
MPAHAQTIREHLTFLYGDRGSAVYEPLQERLDAFARRHPELLAKRSGAGERLTERDVVLITYGDQVREPGIKPLRSLGEFAAERLQGLVSTVHILPFCPYSSDDGFAVVDYLQVNPAWGTWDDITAIGGSFRLMFDLVLNHMSRQSEWFKRFCAGDDEFANHFIVVDPGADLSQVTRPRTLPLLTQVETSAGPRWVWTTFSDDQIDLNFAEPTLLLRMIDVLLYYAAQGAEIIRLDAIAYLWKRIGTSCIHLEETHRVVKLLRAILDQVAPGVMIITETNVPHTENISYFGNGIDEAQLVYQFPLPPLTLHAIASGDASYLTHWAQSLMDPGPEATFYNFLASHDGIGVRPVEGILPPSEVQALAERVQRHGGHVSYRSNPDGSQTAYELNISYFDALSDPRADEAQALQVARFMAAHAVILSLQGVPAIYVHSLLGSRNDHEGVRQTGHPRSINREKLARARLEQELDHAGSLRAAVLAGFERLLTTRRAEPAFHPTAGQQVLDLEPELLALRRQPCSGAPVLCLINVSDHEMVCWAPLDRNAIDVLSGRAFAPSQGHVKLKLAPYEVLWLKEVQA